MCLLYYSENEETMNTLTDLIKSDMIPAFGVTEPGAVAFAVASARERTRGEIQMVKVILNKGIYKNAYTAVFQIQITAGIYMRQLWVRLLQIQNSV